MNCPNCHTALHITERLGIEIDYCQACRGVWLDRGELDKIIQKATENDPSQPGYIPQSIPPAPREERARFQEPGRYREPERHRDYDDDDDHDDRYRKKKKRGDCLSDLFDF